MKSQCHRVLEHLKSGKTLTAAQAAENQNEFDVDIEVWKEIDDVRLNGYAVSSHGRVRSLERHVNHPLGGLKIVREKVLKISSFSSGYSGVTLSKGRGSHLIHRLVAIAFLPNKDFKPCVNHIDGDKKNNHVSNLEWCSYSENERHSYVVLGKKPSKTSLGKFGENNSGSKRVVGLSLDGKALSVWGGASEAARELRTYQGHLSAICRGERPSNLGMEFKYISHCEYVQIKKELAAMNVR